VPRPPGTRPRYSPGLLSDVAAYFLRRPQIPTLIRFDSEAERERYQDRILQRLGWHVGGYGILNIHRIGIDAPVLTVWEEVQHWGPACDFWPNRVATIDLDRRSPGTFEVFLFGRRDSLFGIRRGLFGFDFVPLFRMDLLQRQDTPGRLDPDNGRFLLYRGIGGYPVGLFSLYLRSAIPAEGERERTQFFFVVAFDFYGRPAWSNRRVVRHVWERVHNRVTANVLNRFKAHCEDEFAQRQEGC
jgi:hypothetical protein